MFRRPLRAVPLVAAVALLVSVGGATGATNGSVRGKIVGVPAAKGPRLAFVDAVPLEMDRPSSRRLAGGLAYALSLPAKPAMLAATVIDFGARKVYSGSTKPFVARGAVRQDVRVRAAATAARQLASSSRADASGVAFEVTSASLTFPGGHTVPRGAIDWVGTLVSVAKLPCRFVETAEHDPRVIEARKIEQTLQDKGLTSAHMDFSKSIHATHTVSSSVTFQSESPGGGFEASAHFTLTDVKTGKSLGSKSVSGHFDGLEEFDQAMQDALNELLSAACKPPSYRYQILDATLTTHAKGTPGPDMCSQFGNLTTTEYRDVTSLSGGAGSEVSELQPTGAGSLSGAIQTEINTTLRDRVEGCQFVVADPPVVPCSFTAPDQIVPATVGIVVEPSQGSSTQVRGYWEVPTPEIGVASGSYDTVCNFPYIEFTFPPEETGVDIPLSTFTDSSEHQLTFSGTKHFERTEFGNVKTTLDYEWSVSVTFRRI